MSVTMMNSLPQNHLLLALMFFDGGFASVADDISNTYTQIDAEHDSEIVRKAHLKRRAIALLVLANYGLSSDPDQTGAYRSNAKRGVSRSSSAWSSPPEDD